MVKTKDLFIRVDNDFKRLIDEIRIDYILKNKRPPSTCQITKALMKKYQIKKEDILYDRFISFK